MSIQAIFTYRKYRLPLALALVCFVVQCASTLLDPWLNYSATALQNGQWWRLWTPYVIHTNWMHWLMNMSALAVITYLHGGYYRPLTFSLLVLVGFPLISLQSYWFSPAQFQFVGLSGWLHAVLIWGALVDTRRHYTSGWLILGGVSAKIAWEQWQGAGDLTAQLIAAPVAIDSHLWGGTSGVVLFALTMLAMVRKVYLRRSQRHLVDDNL